MCIYTYTHISIQYKYLKLEFFFQFFILNILDIHAAAKEIAEVNEINLEKVWDMLLEKWLCPSTKPGEVSTCCARVEYAPMTSSQRLNIYPI